MIYLFIDFEMQAVSRYDHPEEWNIARHEIIEIGAVMIDRNGNELGSFKRYVKPEYSVSIQKIVTEMTGIDAETLKDEENFTPVFTDFVEWTKSYNEPYTVFAWSGSDKGQLQHELTLKKYPKTDDTRYMLSHWKDFQKKFTRLLNRQKAVALDKAIKAVGLEFEGQEHDALWDARNTARLYILTMDKAAFLAQAPVINKRLDSENQIGTSIGDILKKKSIDCQ